MRRRQDDPPSQPADPVRVINLLDLDDTDLLRDLVQIFERKTAELEAGRTMRPQAQRTAARHREAHCLILSALITHLRLKIGKRTIASTLRSAAQVRLAAIAPDPITASVIH